MKADGLFYYFHTFAKALNAVGDDQFVDATGKSHDWRRELAEPPVRTAKRRRQLDQHQRTLA